MAGPWEKYANPSTRYGADPVKVREQQLKEEANNRANEAAARAAAAAERANANSANANENTRIQTEIALATKGLTLAPDGSIVARPGGPVGGKPPADPARIAKLNSLIDQINRTQQLYEAGPGATDGMKGIADYLPTDANVMFDTSGAQLSEKGLAAFRIPGSGTMTDRDAAMFERANMPTASTRDAGIEEQLRGIRSRVDAELEQLGLPAAKWEGVQQQLATGKTRREVDPVASGIIDRMIRQGKSAEEINAVLGPLGFNPVGPGDVSAAQDYLRKNPKYDKSFGRAERILPIENPTLNAALQTAPGTAAATYLNAGGFGIPQALNPQAFEALREESPGWAFAGDVGGIITATSGIGAVGNSLARSLAPNALTGGGRLGNAARAIAPDAVYGAGYGAVTEGDPLTGAATAAVGSGAGQIIGAPVGRALANTVQSSPRAMQGLNAVSQIFGGRAKPTLPQMSTAQRMMVDAVGDRGPQVLNNLQQAAQMGVPMSLADADTGLTALGGQVVRRSPDARNIAINAFEPRAQGQYDRLVGAVERDFGPVANIPQRSEDLIQQARAASRPLYEPLESLPPRTSPALDEMLNTNAGMTAMRNATQIADAQRAPAGSMAIGQDAAGNPVFTATPNFQTLNYVKQGFDRSYETLKRAGDPLAGSINSLRKDYLAEMDNLYPGYAEARAAYAGPAAEREAFQAGVGARNMTPDGLAFAIKDMPEPRLEQFRLGRISDIVDQAGKVKYTANPWNSVVGSPAEQQRLATLFPENAPSFIKQYQLERDIARSQNAILGGSPTAERQLMDQAFQGNLAGDMALDAMTTGAPIKSGLNILGRFGKDELGRIGAEKKAKEIAPVLFDTDAAKAAEAFRKSKKAKKARGIFGRRGARAGASVVSAPIMTSGYE